MLIGTLLISGLTPLSGGVALPRGRDSEKNRQFSRDVGAAGGRIIIPPYPAADELSGIYVTKSARGVDAREVKSRFDNSRPLVPHSTSFA
jgi:hypothetical protein